MKTKKLKREDVECISTFVPKSSIDEKRDELNKSISNQLIEFKRENQFSVSFGEPFQKIDPYMLCECSRPSYDAFEQIWEPIMFIFRDPVGISTTKIIYDGLKILEKTNDLVNVEISILDPVGLVVEKWEIKGEICKVEYGSLSYYSDGDLLKITMEFIVSHAELVEL